MIKKFKKTSIYGRKYEYQNNGGFEFFTRYDFGGRSYLVSDRDRHAIKNRERKQIKIAFIGQDEENYNPCIFPVPLVGITFVGRKVEGKSRLQQITEEILKEI